MVRTHGVTGRSPAPQNPAQGVCGSQRCTPGQVLPLRLSLSLEDPNQAHLPSDEQCSPVIYDSKWKWGLAKKGKPSSHLFLITTEAWGGESVFSSHLGPSGSVRSTDPSYLFFIIPCSSTQHSIWLRGSKRTAVLPRWVKG